MSNAEIFLTPGSVTFSFILSLFDLSPASFDPVVYKMMTIVIAAFLWLKCISILIAIVRQATGFDGRR